ARRYPEQRKPGEGGLRRVPRVVGAGSTAGMQVLTFARGDIVIREGEAADAFFVIGRGEAEVVGRDNAGQEHVLNTLKEDQYFGELGLLRAEPRNATVRAKTSLEVIRVSADAFRMMVESSKQTADDIARVAQSRVRTEVGSPR